MPQTKTNTPDSGPALPSPADAYNYLVGEVHARAFFNKLASYGVAPRSEQEAVELLELGAKLRGLDMQKQAQDGGHSLVGEASRALDAVAGTTSAGQEYARAKVASDLMQDPDIYRAVLSLKLAEAEARR